MSALSDGLSDNKAWMSLNFIYLNESKTEVIVFGSLAVSGNIQQVMGDLAAYQALCKNKWVLCLILL